MAPSLPKLIALDNDDKILSQVARVFAGRYSVAPLKTPLRALALLESGQTVHAIVTEQVMCTADGVHLLETVRTMRPDVRRVMLTNYSDLATIISGLHSGAIQSLVQKPVSDAELLLAVCPELAQQNSVGTIRRATA